MRPQPTPPAPRPAWHAMPAEHAADLLGTDVRRGLSEDEAGRRLEEIGPNRLLRIGAVPWWRVAARQFANALILVLVAAAALSAAVGETADAIAIGAIVVLNGILGFIQEWRAERAIEALQQMLAPRCRVRRNGRARGAPASELVPGDIVELDAGDRVPADLRVLESTDAAADQSSLTGESTPVAKGVPPVAPETSPPERGSMLWMGTTLTSGRAVGIVVATGMATEFGRIAELTQRIDPAPTPLQRRLGRLARQLGTGSIAVAVLVGILGLTLGRPLLEMVLTGVSLAVAIVPEGLPAVVTVVLALGLRSLARQRALLRRLHAAETLGAATVICTDKTGTITANEMTLRELWLASGTIRIQGAGFEPTGTFEREGESIDPQSMPDLRAALETGLFCNHAGVERAEGRWRAVGEATEAALVVAALKAGLRADDRPEIAYEIPFSAARRRMTVMLCAEDGCVAHVKGAPETILERCSQVLENGIARRLTTEDRRGFQAALRQMADRGLRTLALARRPLPEPPAPGQIDAVEADLTLIGLAGILDPPRPEVGEAIRVTHRAGIAVVMITGDAPATALAIARDIGLAAERAVTGEELATMADAVLDAAIGGDTVFARTLPEQKLRIVEAMQRQGHVVAMTGDGVNDAPALKRADIGVAMGIRGTDVARDASDLIITDDNYATIVRAVREGRRQYDNIRKFVRYLLSSNTGEVAAILLNLVIGGPLILLPVQILWMNLVTDGPTALALGLEPGERGLMRRPPRDPRGGVLDRSGLAIVIALGLYIGGATVWLYRHYLGSHGPEGLATAQTMAFTGIILIEKMNVFNFRSLRAPLTLRDLGSNPRLLAAWAAMIGLQVLAVYAPPFQRALHTVPLQRSDWIHIAALAIPIVVAVEAVKRATWRGQG